MKSNRERFLEDGYVVLRGVLDASQVLACVGRLKELAGDKDRWTLPDGVNRHAPFWPIIFNPTLLGAVREVFGPDIRYLPHNDLHVGFSSFSWHRDSVNRDAGVGPDWDERIEPYRIARVGLYLQRFEDSRFSFGVVPGSHRPDDRLSRADRQRVRRRTSALANVVSGLSGVDLVGKDATWIATGPGDAVVFDPRLLHTGSRFHGMKYSIFVAYGVENRHFRHHWHYYLNLRRDLGYSRIDPTLAERLRAADLLASEPPENLHVDGAWIPSGAYTYVARRFK